MKTFFKNVSRSYYCSETAETKKSSTRTLFQGMMSGVIEQAR